MPQSDFFLSKNEERQLVSAVFEQGVHLVPDLDYERAQYVSLSNPGGYYEYRPQTQLFFIIADDYARCPLEIKSTDSGPRAGRYFIMQRNGGPTIDFFAPRVRGEPPGAENGSGFLAYYPTFWNTLRERNEAPPAELRTRYKRLNAVVRGMSKRLRTSSGRTYWVGREVLEDVRLGASLAGVDDPAAVAVLVGSER